MSKQLYSVDHQAFHKGWKLIKFIPVAGDGVQAPGAVTMCEIDDMLPFVVHFFNAQDGGFHNGNYCSTRKEAEQMYAQKALRFMSFAQGKEALGLTKELQCPECGRDYKGDEELKAGDTCPSDDCQS